MHRIISAFSVQLVVLVSLFSSVPAVHAEPADPARFKDRPAAVSRHFADIAGRQIHFRKAGQAGEQVPVVLFHQSPNSSQVFIEFMAELGGDRLILAPDTPGFGQSDLPSKQPDIADYAKAMTAFLDSQSLGRVDLLGYHTGAAIAIEVARTNPERVRRLIVVGLPVFTPAEAAAFDEQPWPVPLDPAGLKIAEEWKRSWQWRGVGQSEDSVRRTFDQKIANGPMAWWGARAALHYDTRAALRELDMPILFIRPRDDLWDLSLRAMPELGKAMRIDMPDRGFGVFEAFPEDMATTVRQFLDSGKPSE